MWQTVYSNPLFAPIVVTLVIIAAFPLVAGYIVLLERKVLADFQVRLGPMRVGPHGLLQHIADALKLLLKEDIIPAESDKAIFWFAPCISTITSLTALAVIPFAKAIFVADAGPRCPKSTPATGCCSMPAWSTARGLQPLSPLCGASATLLRRWIYAIADSGCGSTLRGWLAAATSPLASLWESLIGNSTSWLRPSAGATRTRPSSRCSGI